MGATDSVPAAGVPDLSWQVFEALVRGSEAQRAAAVAAISNPAGSVDRARLRLIIGDALDRDYVPRRPRRGEEEQDESDGWARSWLLNALGRIAADDAEARARVRRHLDPDVEFLPWVQYWVLEALVITKADDLPELARQIVDHEHRHDPLVTMLARAILAERGNDQALQELEDGLGNRDLQWPILRALRIVHLGRLCDRLVTLLEEPGYSDAKFDAIVALGTAPRGSLRAEQAARTLGAFIAKYRRSTLFDGMKTAALKVLGKLGDESVTPLLIEELTADSPTEAREAALALEKIVGIPIAAARVVQAACKPGAPQVSRYARALQWMDRDALAGELDSLMISGRSDEQTMARQLLSEIGGASAFDKLRARTTAVAQYAAETEKAEEKVRKMFEESVAEARTGFKIATAMDIAVFVVGILLLAGSAVVVLAKEGKLDSWLGVGIAGGTGVAGILYTLVIARPRRQIVDAVDHLMELKVVFLAYLRQLHQADQAYTRAVLESKLLGAAEVREFSGMVETTMQVAVEQLGMLRPHQRANVAGARALAARLRGAQGPDPAPR
jgi:HEAT repeat protein